MQINNKDILIKILLNHTGSDLILYFYQDGTYHAQCADLKPPDDEHVCCRRFSELKSGNGLRANLNAIEREF